MLTKLKTAWQSNVPQALASIIVLVGIFFLFYLFYSLFTQNKFLKSDRVRLTAEVEQLKGERETLLTKVNEQAFTIESFGGTIQKIGQTVGTLEKLAQTDEELLKKYSKVYFLNENYIPAKLSQLEGKYVFNKSNDYYIHTDVKPYLERLIDAAEKNNIELLVASAYRSFGTQSDLKSAYRVSYGSGANQFSADQGYSEHQLGTTVDFTTAKVGGVFSRFEADPAYTWLLKHAHDYGFILSYPKSNTYYKFEPWHWRYVGISLATKLYEEGKYFYDLDQREIDSYLINLFN